MFTCINYEMGCLGRNIGCRLGCVEIVKELNIKASFPDLDKNNCDKVLKQIENLKGRIFIGGDHSISYALVKGFFKRFKNFGLVVFDAHPDCCEPFKTVTHEDWLRKLIEEKVIKKENILLFGIREVDKTEFEFLKGMSIIKCKEILENKDYTNKLMNFINKFKNIYLSLDIDVVDPKDAPGT
ncbi:arginase family protein, partial [Candidatus Woesearchaeota archaeon]|nr:arginase family protein [Candidatus Woesearchaeota archaeon]